jgi:NADH-quinone oxidoreductase subunit J
MMVVLTRNSVHSVLWLIFTFLNSAGLFILLGAEFIAMSIVVVYVGAVAVLFLFVVMMIDTKNKTSINVSNLVCAFILGGVLICQLSYLIIPNTADITTLNVEVININDTASGVDSSVDLDRVLTNTEQIANVLYSQFFLEFQMCGIVLLLAMVGCIAIAVRKDVTGKHKRTNSYEQVLRESEDCIVMTSPTIGKGLSQIKYDSE